MRGKHSLLSLSCAVLLHPIMLKGRKKDTSGHPAVPQVNYLERFRPDRRARPRRRLDNVWRVAPWTEAYPDDCLTMNAVDLTPTLALRKLAVLFEAGKVPECAALMRRLSAITLDSVLKHLPVDVLHDALPVSLPILEVIYVKVAQRGCGPFPTEKLCTDQLVQYLVAIFAKCPLGQTGSDDTVFSNYCGGSEDEEKNCNLHLSCCRSILRVIMERQPNLRRTIAQKKKVLDRCLRWMGQHGLVSCSDGQLQDLHQALRRELDLLVAEFKVALSRLEQPTLSTSSKLNGTVESKLSGSSRTAPTQASHQRLMQLTREDVQERLIKNKTLLTSLEPAVRNLTLHRLLRTLQSRVEADKLLLFHDTELRKLTKNSSMARLTAISQSASPSSCPKDQQIAKSLRRFSQGYGALLRLMSEILAERGKASISSRQQVTEEEEESSSEEGDQELRGLQWSGWDIPALTSPLPIMKKMKVISLTGVLPVHAAAYRSAVSGRTP